MGTAELKNTFSSEMPQGYACQQALLYYERDAEGEWQHLVFRGTKPDGTAFEVKADRHRPNADPVVVARETAQAFLKSEGKN